MLTFDNTQRKFHDTAAIAFSNICLPFAGTANALCNAVYATLLCAC